ncbi:hypothetical protein K8O68_06975 [Salipaludibacillus sp. CUR1]|uniref:DoxX family protein n=1 Tax=Salipaludibacillus sp. CUR1 TaxID=2820003 RepID=UPI001E4CF95C|nr:hypothetical protein [Salipaludibacillus sp. CUR1]MCE7792166.1 hypothetical protein [Salipaludibacillus sp. CUR1]
MKAVRVFYSVLLFVAGILHFVHERGFRRIVPKHLPFRRAIVLVSGAIEMLFSILLWVKKAQLLTSKLLAIFLVIVFPANIYMAVKKISFIPGKPASPWILWLRLPLQIPLVLGALALGKKKGNE